MTVAAATGPWRSAEQRIERELQLAGAPPALGTMVPGSERSLVVIDRGGELAVALRDRLDPALVVIKHAYPGEAPGVLRSCRPWPWMVVGVAPELPMEVDAVLGKPVLAAWFGDRPAGLPPHARSFLRFADLVRWVDESLRSEVAGMHLAIGSGVDLPGGGHVRSAALEALISAGRSGLHLPLPSFRGAARAVAVHGLPVRPGTDPLTGRVCLRGVSR
jgi:hypothetical protein